MGSVCVSEMWQNVATRITWRVNSFLLFPSIPRTAAKFFFLRPFSLTHPPLVFLSVRQLFNVPFIWVLSSRDSLKKKWRETGSVLSDSLPSAFAVPPSISFLCASFLSLTEIRLSRDSRKVQREDRFTLMDYGARKKRETRLLLILTLSSLLWIQEKKEEQGTWVTRAGDEVEKKMEAEI